MTSKNSKIGTILITGISAAGKTTLGRRLFQDLKNKNINNLKLFDGEEVRNLLAKEGNVIGYSLEDRYKHMLDLAKMAKECNDQGQIAIVCAIASSRGVRERVRSFIGNMLEVYLDCPVEVCANRDYKHHYEKAFKGLYETFIGVTDPYETSSPELVLQTGVDSKDKCSEVLLEKTLAFLQNGYCK